MKEYRSSSIIALLLWTAITLLLSIPASAHDHSHDRKIEFPDIPGYRTLKCDFHQHSVFSDGYVWPNIRVMEALEDGLDAISITDHLEYQPHKEDIPHPDRNRSYQIALKAAEGKDLIVVLGAEITRKMPPGHANAIFISDANKLLADSAMAAFREARNQGAFIFWNHPNWIAQRPDGIATLTDMHRMLIKEGLLNGIEIVNDVTYSEEALQIALDHHLTIMGTSDIHGLVDWRYKIPEGGHRPVTLVFAKEKSEAALKDALLAGRTVVWFDNILAGRSEYLTPLIEQSLTVKNAKTLQTSRGPSIVQAVTIENNSDADYILENLSGYSLHSASDVLTIPAHDTTLVEVKTVEQVTAFDLRFRVLNAVTAPGQHPEVVLKVVIAEAEK